MSINRLENIRRALLLTEEVEKILDEKIEGRDHWMIIDNIESVEKYLRGELRQLEKEKIEELKGQPQ